VAWTEVGKEEGLEKAVAVHRKEKKGLNLNSVHVERFLR
jgi:hypothetical protein